MPELPEMTVIEQTFADLWAAGASPDSHPIAHVRDQLVATGLISIAGADARKVFQVIRWLR